MLRGLTGIIVLMLVGLSAGLHAQTPSTQPTASEIEAVIAKLSADEWRVRQKAQEQLVEIGQAAVERLQRLVRETKDEEVRTRAEAALREIEIHDRSKPTLITLHLRNVPLPAALEELAKQANTEIALWPPFLAQQNPPKVSVDADRKPFWMVVKDICMEAGLEPERVGSRQAITLMQRRPNGWAQRPSVLHNGIMITAERAHRSHSVDFSAPANVNHAFSIQFEALIDPKLRVLHGPSQVKLEEVVDEKGNSLAPPGQTSWAGHAPHWGSGWIWNINANLNYQPDTGKRIARFKGSARFLAVEKADVWEISDVLNVKNVERLLPSGKYTVKSIAKDNANQYQVDVAIQTTGNPNGMTDYSTLQQCLRLVDADGRAYRFSGGGGGGPRMNQVQYKLHFHGTTDDGRKLGPPAKLIWEVPLELREIIVPFEFKDLPIP